MAKQTKHRALLDSCALLAWIKEEPSSSNLNTLMQQIDNQEIELAKSVLIFTEVYKKSQEKDLNIRQNQDQTLKTILSKLESPHTLLFDITINIAKKATDLRIQHNLKTADAIHLAPAILNNCHWFITADSDFPSDCKDVKIYNIAKETIFPWDNPQLELPIEK